ncbi:calcium-binding protein [Salipiger sp. P9]|uniref:calcium-binding protein n=1 Tax=Salipiger pentaromativorans TaxID=2943193 RepID=UPI002157BB7A|nr:calcium-binding protein [Salipiger pentaromativorans]MCR8549108.1 calcium-binding protein [Salipiger pentaromativorans]
MFARVLRAVVLVTIAPLMAMAEGRDEADVYVFGNSLVHYLGEQPQSNVPHWMNEMARADGRRLALDGQWGFLRGFAESLPPAPNWSFDGVTSLWDPGRGSFADAGFDAVLITPANFIQYQPPEAPYEGDNPSGASPLSATLTVVDWLRGRIPETPVYLYEGWADMSGVAGRFPPSNRALRRYHDYNLGDYHDWYETLLADLRAERPDTDLRLIPVARLLSSLLGEGGLLEEVPVEALYVDPDPHGTPTLYFLAAMITYAALYEAPPPAGYTPPATLHPEVVAAYPELAAWVWQEISATESLRSTATAAPAAAAPIQTAAAPTPETLADAPLPARGEVSLPAPGARPQGLPALGMGLNGIADWSTQQPFIDLMKTAREWIGHLPGQWGGVSADELRAEGVLDDNGWPLRLPERVERLEALLLTDQPEAAEHLRGTYLVLYDGQGKLELTGRARRVLYDEGEAQFSYSPGEGAVGISISATDPADPIRNIRVIREDQRDLYEAGVLFNPLWIDRIHDLRSVRFMDWMMTNGSPVQSWADRPRVSDYTWSAWGVPLEVMIALANQIGADPWFNMPHMANDAYVRSFAETVKAGLDPRLKAYVEYSNEVWNHIFPQAGWAETQADALWGRSETGWMQYYGLRAAQMMRIWSDVFGAEIDDRLVRVMATHTGWPGLEENVLVAPLAYLQLGHPPQEDFDAYAVAAYFGYELGGEEMAAQMDNWLARSEAQAVAEGEAEGLRRVALREFVKGRRYEAAVAPVALALQEGSLKELIEEVLPYHAGAAEAAGLHLVMYEGGTHVTAQAARVEDERLTGFFEYFNYTPEMAKLYEELLTGWVSAGGTLFNAFVDVAPASKWGSWGALRHLEDANPRWDMLMAYNASGPSDWETRDPAAFADGLLRRGEAGADRLEGTAQADILLGGAGNDLLIPGGGQDHLHGGPGQDRALLPGSQDGYSFTRDGARLVAKGPAGTVTMVSVEQLSFEAAPDTEIATAGL